MNPVKIVCLGDSLTGPVPGEWYQDKFLKWPDLLGLMATARLGGGRAVVFNRGHAGGNSAHARERLPSQVLAEHPDLVAVLIGGNDFGHDADPISTSEKLRQNLTAIVRAVKEAGSKILLLQYFQPRAENMAGVWTHLNSGNPVIAEVAAVEEVPLLPLEPSFQKAADTYGISTLTDPVDGVHLRPFGETVVAEAVFHKFTELGWL
jgi:lysophospholipase L1-like esterase